MEIALIAVAYNRIEGLKELLLSLSYANYDGDKVNLIISVDKSNNDVVETYADSFVWNYGEKMVAKHNNNLGLRRHMLSLGNYFERYDALVVLEDDITVSPNFYIYTKQTVLKYIDDNRIAGISLYKFDVNYQTEAPFIPLKDENDVFFMNCAMSWGEVWMKRQWMEFKNWYDNNDVEFNFQAHLPNCLSMWDNKSWLKYHTRYCIEKNKLFIYPYVSLSTNNGEPGEHKLSRSNVQQVPMQYGKVEAYKLPDISKDAVIYDGFFENIKLYQKLNQVISSNDICIDLNGSKGNRENNRYWLTVQSVGFKVIQSYGLRYRPIEMNVLLDISGNDIFLYDTSIFAHKPKICQNRILYDLKIDSMILLIRKYSLKMLIKEFIYLITNRM